MNQNPCTFSKKSFPASITVFQTRIPGKKTIMWSLKDLQGRREIIDRIDWDMTPEKAVETFLEWGTGWSRKGDFVQYHDQESLYFVVYDWEQPPQVTLIRRDIHEAEELAKIVVPAEMAIEAVREAGRKPGVGVYAISDRLKEWLKKELGC